MQVFALAEHLAAPLPAIFQQSAHGMRWTLFQVGLFFEVGFTG
jgi:uncharacterized membrane protein